MDKRGRPLEGNDDDILYCDCVSYRIRDVPHVVASETMGTYKAVYSCDYVVTPNANYTP